MLWLIVTGAVTVAGELHTVMPVGANMDLFVMRNGCVLEEMAHTTGELRLRFSDCTTQPGHIDTPIAGRISHVHWEPATSGQVELRIGLLGNQRITARSVEDDPDDLLLCMPACGDDAPTGTQRFIEVKGLTLDIPLQGMDLDAIVDRSLGHVPTQDIVRDGLPNFGSVRDDWLGRSRSHKGIDIYVDSINVIAAADGRVTQVGSGGNSGQYIKIHHSDAVSTVYVHLRRALVRKGARVSRRQVIGTIDGASGNAVEPQLHFELQVNGIKVDPFGYLKQDKTVAPYLLEKIRIYEAKLSDAARIRALLVQ